ncbi:MAG: cell wall-active antibiotics response protein [Spirochaetales bacterium]|nr:cell wall-active antibiotics response protein [Spirochaetales bacterium]
MDQSLDQEKNKILDELSLAFSRDRISLDDYERVVGLITKAPNFPALQEAIRDYPIGANTPGVSQGSSTTSGTRTSVAIFSGTELKGRFKASRHHRALAVFGGVDIDLRDAVIPSEGMTIETAAVFGGIDIFVPPTVNVVTSGFAIFGGFESHDQEAEMPGAPTIYIKGVAVFGGVEVKKRKRRF